MKWKRPMSVANMGNMTIHDRPHVRRKVVVKRHEPNVPYYGGESA